MSKDLLVSPAASDAAAIVDAMEKHAGAEVVKFDVPRAGYDEQGDLRIESVPVAFVPRGREVQSLKKLIDEYLPRPRRIEGQALLQDEESFIDHVNAMKREATAVFFDRSKNVFVAVYDYHKPDRPDWCEHRASWGLKLSREWQAWSGIQGRALSQQEFATFLEAQIPDVFWGDQYSDHTKLLIQQLELRLATPSQLVALSRNIAINVDTAVRNAQTLSTGEIAIVYTEQHRDGEGQPITVPNAFLIAIPVVEHGPLYQVLVRLGYRVREGRITWHLHWHRADLALELATQEIAQRVVTNTGLPVYAGTPEA